MLFIAGLSRPQHQSLMDFGRLIGDLCKLGLVGDILSSGRMVRIRTIDFVNVFSWIMSWDFFFEN